MSVFVEVILRHDKYGNKRPMFIKWNNGTLYEIDRVKNVSRAVSGNGMQVTKYDIITSLNKTKSKISTV